jgi:GNAT superfamily N-acetyltransferase
VTRRDVAATLDPMPPAQRQRMVQAMDAIEAAMGADAEPARYTLRAPRPGDITLVIARQSQLYAEEYGWNGEFEIMAGEIAVKFAKNFDPKRERCWIAERDGAVIGSIFLVRESDAVAKLRLLYVDAAARGLGLGKRLVEECVAQARAFGYKKLVLWTNDILSSARRIYVDRGFKLVKEERHHSFGKDLVGQYWELDLEANECPAERRRSA